MVEAHVGIGRVNTVASRSAYPSKRVTTRTVYQMESVECGAASLAMILGYYGRVVPLEQLRRDCGVSRDGSKASNIVKAARNYGLIAKGFQRSVDELFEGALPVIVFWKFNHFLVVEGVTSRGVYLNDPIGGKRVVSHEDFDAGYTGIVLTFEPGPDFVSGGTYPSLMSSLLRRVTRVRTGLMYVVLASILLIVPGLLTPVFAKIFIDDVLVRKLDSWMKPLLLGMGATVIFHGVLAWLQRSVLLRMESSIAVQESAAYMWHILRLPVEFFQQRFAGDIAQRVQINNSVAQMIGGKLATSVLNLLMITVYAVVMLSYNLNLALITIGITAVNVAAMRAAGRRLGAISERLLREQGKLQGVAMNGLQIIETLKAGGNEQDFFAQWAGYQAKVQDSQRRLQFIMQTLIVIPPVVSSITTALVLGIGGSYVMDGLLTIGSLVAFQSLLASFQSPLQQLLNLYADVQRLRGDMARLDDVLKYDQDLSAAASDGSGMPMLPLEGHVELRNITFGYSPLDPPLIKDFSLVLRPGSRVALVGKSGCGKSTLSKLIMGIYTPWSGEILFDGKPRTSWSRDTIVASLAIVDQDVFLFDGTVQENLTMWNDATPSSHVIQAAKDAQIHDVVAARAGGYASRVEEGGRNFSGGQAQRLEIARALVGNPRMLVLDEATSALDPITEQHIDTALRRRGVTTIIVAHRLSTIRDCDEIIVLDRGKVVQRGTHDQLKMEDGMYASLIAAE